MAEVLLLMTIGLVKSQSKLAPSDLEGGYSVIVRNFLVISLVIITYGECVLIAISLIRNHLI